MVTIKDVAKHAGVSIATISRVINNRGPISERTIEKVNNAMRELNYNPNTIARSLAKGRNSCIGVILPTIGMPYWAQVSHELENAAAERGYSIMIAVSPNCKDTYIKKFQYLAASRPEGIITSYIDGAEDFIANSQIPVLTWANSSHTKPSISSDDRMGGMLATRHLIAKGCKSLIHISGNLAGSSSGNARSYAFIDECEKCGIKYRVFQVSESQNWNLDYSDVMSDVYSLGGDFDGIFASNDIIAANCLSMALRLGYRVPEDIKIVGYDDVNISSLLYPPLSTIHQDIRRLAELAIDSLLALAAGEKVPDRQVVPVRLVERKTT